MSIDKSPAANLRRIRRVAADASLAAGADSKAEAADAKAESAAADAAAALAAAEAYPALQVLKCYGTLTSSIANVSVLLDWATVLDTPAITHKDGIFTVHTTGVYQLQVTVRTVSNNRSELVLSTFLDTGSGSAALPGEIASDYVARDTGGVTLSTVLALSAGDLLRFEALSDADGTCSLLTEGTIFVATRLS